MKVSRPLTFLILCAALAVPSVAVAADLININTASLSELETLPGVGPSIAQSIIDNRPYASIQEVSRANGIGEPGSSSYEKIKNLITIGTTNTTQAQSQTQSTSTDTQTQVQAQTVGGMTPPPITAEITTDKTSVVAAGSLFSAEAFGTQGDPIQNARFVWNFGDGATAEGPRVVHAFSYPGTYAVVLTASSGFSTAQARVVVVARAAQLTLIAENDGSLLIANNASQPLDVGLWTLVCGQDSFTIPQETLVLADGGIRFSPTITRLFCGADAQLRYPNGARAAEARLSADSPLRGEPVNAAHMRPVSVKTPASNSGVVAGTSSSVASVGSAPADAAPSPLLAWIIGLGALAVIGVGAVFYLRPLWRTVALAPTPPATADYEEEFEVE